MSMQTCATSLPMMDPAPSRADAVLTTMSVPLRQRLDFWHAYVCQTIAGVNAKPLGNKQNYNGQISSRALPIGAGTRGDFLKVTANPQLVSRTSQLIARRPEDNWLLMIQNAGICTVTQNGREVRLAPGDIAFLDTSRPYEIAFPVNFKQSILKFPDHVFRNLFPMRRDVAGMALRGEDALVAIARTNLVLLDGLAHTIDPADLPGVAGRAIEHVAHAMRVRLDGKEPRKESDVCAQHFSRASAYICGHLQDPALSAGRVADALGLSAGRLHDVFRANSTVTAGDFIKQQRLEKCRRELADPSMRHQSITSIAFRWGFSEASSFSRAFRAAFQTSPRLYRQTFHKALPRDRARA